MDRSYSETNEERDFTDGTIKRRISSILKAPRTPLQNLGSGNELIQDYNIEKRQRNSRRVSFADTIRVFPPDPQIIVELKQAVSETAGEPRVQDFFHKNEDPEVVSCEITGMSTLLHAPIQTCLQQTECCDAETGQAWNKMDRTVIFSEENEMDMTSGHTIVITHGIRIREETNNTRKINFKSFSAGKSDKETSQMNECHLFSGPAKMNDTSLSQQQLNTENPPKINFSDFLNSLKSTVHSLPTGVMERNVGYSHFHEEDCNTTTASGIICNIQNPITSRLSNKSTVTLPSKQVGCEQENTSIITTNMENVLPPGTSSLNMADSQERDWSASNNMDSGGLKTSRNQFGVQEDQRLCVNELTMNDIESIADKKHTEIKEDASFSYYKTSIMPRSIDSVTSMPVFNVDRTSVFRDFSADMELTRNCTGLAWEENFKGIGDPFAQNFGKQGNDVSRLMEETIFQEEHMDITNNQIPSHSYVHKTKHSALNERPGPLQEVTYNKMGLQNSRILGDPQTPFLPETNYCPLGQVTKSFGSQTVSPFLSSTHDIMQQAHTKAGENEMKRKSRLPNNMSLISNDQTARFHFSENMDITEPITYLENSLNAHGFLALPQQGLESDQKNVIGLNSNKTTVFSLNEDNEMDITRSHRVPVNYDMQPCQKTLQACSIQSAVESVYMCNDYMDETGMINQFIENSTQKQSNESRRRTLTGQLKDRTVVFSLDENEMEMTKSHTVTLKRDVVAKDIDIPLSSALFSNKTAKLTVGEDMKITRPVEYVPESLQNTSKKNVMKSASEKTRPALTESNDMELTKRLKVAVDGTPQFSLIPSEKNSMSIHSSDMKISQSVHFVPENKTMLFMHNNDMEITKPMTSTSLKEAKVKDLEVEKEETIKVILQGRVKKWTDTYLYDNCEMEITKNHTVPVNHDILQQVKETPQELASASVGKTSIFAHLSDAKTQSKTYVPADKTFTCNNDMEIIKPVSDSRFTALSPKEKEIRKTTLLGLNKDDTTVFSQHDAEMENTKCHTVRVTHDVVSQCERAPQVSFHQNNMNTTGSHTVTKEMMADDGRVNKKHTITLDYKTDLPCKTTLQAESTFPVSTTCTVTSFHSTKVSSLPCNATYNGNLEESGKKEMPDKNIKQNMNKALSHTYVEKIPDVDVTENQVVSIYGSNNDVPDAEKEILNPFTKSKEKAAVSSDGNNMEITQNYKTGIEFMHINDSNECHPNSEAKFGSRFSALVNDYESKLEIAQTEKNQFEAPASVMLPMCLNTELKPKDYLQIKENLPALCNVNTFSNELTLHIVSNEGNGFMLPTTEPILSKETSNGLNSKKMPILVNEIEILKNNLNKSQSEQEASSSGQTDPLPFGKEYRKETREWSSITKDCQNNLESPLDNTFSSEKELDILSELSGVDSSCPKTKDTRKKSELVLLSQDVASTLRDVLPKLTTKLDSSLNMKEDPKKELDTVTSTEWTNVGFTERASVNVPLHTESYNITKLPLGIFPPKLPNKRKSTVSSTESATAGLEKRKQTQDSEVSLVIKRLSDKLAQNPNLSCYINEELLPAYEEEIDSNEALSCDIPERLYDVGKDEGIAGNEDSLSERFETNKRQRALNQGDEELQKEKKFKGDEGWNDSGDFKQPICSTATAYLQGAAQEGKNVPELITVNLEKTQSSNSSSLDSVQQNSEMETQLLVDSICEQNLQEKFQEGTITVREFFTLLEVHVLIQKPRQSLLPPKYEINTTPNLEDEIINQYVYHPKLLAYGEDCQALCKTVDELKVNANNQDKLLVNVHKSLWEVMRTCSDKELKVFGAELNKMKSCFTKKSKVLAHKAKAKLYAKLVQNAELQWEKLQSRLAKIDELLEEMDSCINDLETEAAALKETELDVNDVVSEYESKVRDTERELEELRVQEEALQRNQSNLRDKKQHNDSEIIHLQDYVKSYQEITEKYNFSEWVMKEWNDHQAVLTFLYDSIELIVRLECPVDGAGYKIVSVNFESLLDDDRALASSKLVHRLVFQFINSQSLQLEKCLTMHHLSQILHHVSLVVSRCQLLGEEIEFLDRWGGKFYLLKTEVNDTKVKFLFSSSVACGSFEVEFSLSANYPASPVAFTIQKCTGNLSQEDISVILSNVPVGANYLRRIVKEISHNVLQCSPSTIQKQQRVAVR
ncbi:kinetochore scaffold 1 isoform X1 [Anolis carolinensis]|uniref:kinetochore scaffold 1 isoform X1 n=1 Tax=Anolis carolinensis TaxID=28377 RepID=UPI002F2B3AF4